MSEQAKSKYNRTGPGANKSVFDTIASDTGIQENVNTDKKKKKATFDLDADLHKKLRIYAAAQDTTMVTIVEEALNEYLNK
jgi:predicted HicB family RNase H-like nuclease